jgi:hypothetical protein
MIRISATVPEDVIAAADAHAAGVNRSRSWLISEALRRYLSRLDRKGEALPEPTPGLGESRLSQLRADLGLTPLERVAEAERTAREASLVRPTAGDFVVTFDSFEDYLEWDRWDALR